MAIELLVESDMIALTGTTIAFGSKVPLENLEGRMRYAEATVTTTGTTTTSTSTYLGVRLPSNAVLKYGTIQGVSTTDLSDMDVGVREVLGANTLVDGAFATALDIDDTGDHDFIGKNGDQDTTKQMWEWAGLSADPGGKFDIHLSLDADAVVAGDFKVKVYYTVD